MTDEPPSAPVVRPSRRRHRQVEKVLHKGTSKFQTIEVLKTKPFGSMLICDGLMNSSEDDEYVYHQSLVHPVMTAHPNPKKVYIAGGGEVRSFFFRIRSKPSVPRFLSARIVWDTQML